MYLRDSNGENRWSRLSSWCGCVWVCVSVCFQGWKIIQNNFKALSVSLFTSPENVVLGSREEIKKEDRD